MMRYNVTQDFTSQDSRFFFRSSFPCWVKPEGKGAYIFDLTDRVLVDFLGTHVPLQVLQENILPSFCSDDTIFSLVDPWSDWTEQQVYSLGLHPPDLLGAIEAEFLRYDGWNTPTGTEYDYIILNLDIINLTELIMGEPWLRVVPQDLTLVLEPLGGGTPTVLIGEEINNCISLLQDTPGGRIFPFKSATLIIYYPIDKRTYRWTEGDWGYPPPAIPIRRFRFRGIGKALSLGRGENIIREKITEKSDDILIPIVYSPTKGDIPGPHRRLFWWFRPPEVPYRVFNFENLRGGLDQTRIYYRTWYSSPPYIKDDPSSGQVYNIFSFARSLDHSAIFGEDVGYFIVMRDGTIWTFNFGLFYLDGCFDDVWRRTYYLDITQVEHPDPGSTIIRGFLYRVRSDVSSFEGFLLSTPADMTPIRPRDLTISGTHVELPLDITDLINSVFFPDILLDPVYGDFYFIDLRFRVPWPAKFIPYHYDLDGTIKGPLRLYGGRAIPIDQVHLWVEKVPENPPEVHIDGTGGNITISTIRPPKAMIRPIWKPEPIGEDSTITLDEGLFSLDFLVLLRKIQNDPCS